MSRFRIVYCLIWNDDKFPFASDDCQLVFFHILTTPFSTPFGCYKCSIEALSAEKRWPLEKYKKAFQEGLREGFFRYDPKHHIIYIPRFLKYNPPNNPNVLKSWAKIFLELPQCDLKKECLQNLKDLVEGFNKGFQEAFNEFFGKAFGKVLVPVPVNNKYLKKGGLGGNNLFERFWEAWPKKVAKEDAKKAFIKLNPESSLFETIIEFVIKAKGSIEWKKDKGQFIPYPATFLNGKRWEDTLTFEEEDQSTGAPYHEKVKRDEETGKLT
jgi:hypothetical protein